MTGCSRWAAGCMGLFLLLPGMCFFLGGVNGLSGRGSTTEMIGWVVFGALLIGGAGWLITVAFRAPDVTLDESPNVVKIRPPTEEPPEKQEPPKAE
jgi:hypothetical protein